MIPMMLIGMMLPVFLAIICLIFLFKYRVALIHAIRKMMHSIDDRIHLHQHFTVPEFNQNGQLNVFFSKLHLYLNSLPSLEDSDLTNLFSGHKSNLILLQMDDDQVIHDSFLGARLSWRNQVHRKRGFVLKIKRKDKRRILQPYLQHIHSVADDVERRTKLIKLFINGNISQDCCRRWQSTPFNHPSTFDTIVMEPDLKTKIISDLDLFFKSEAYYQKLGRVWKRSYLLYGPSGTGKTSFIAAMANYLSFDVYDVDLKRVLNDADLKILLLQTTSKSIIVVEDIDRFFNDKSSTLNFSLPGILNFMDGIVNGEERIFIFTMNTKDGVDSAMLRPGRIDVHVHFPLCDFNSFKSLASNYLGVKEHKLFPHVEAILQSGSTISPAEIGELMLVHRRSPSRALKSVLTALQGSSSAKNGGRISTTESTSSSPAPPPQTTVECGSPAWKDSVPGKELRKLYGILKLKSSKKSGPLDPDSGLIERS